MRSESRLLATDPTENAAMALETAREEGGRWRETDRGIRLSKSGRGGFVKGK